MSADDEQRSEQVDEQHAVVLSGNGSNGAYEVGVLKALLQGISRSTANHPIRPEIYTGVSVGALNAAFMVSESEDSDLAAVEKLEKLWTDQIATPEPSRRGTPRLRGNPFEYANPAFYLPNPMRPLLDLGADALFVGRDFLKRAGDFVKSVKPAHPLAGVQEFVFDYDWSVLSDLSPVKRLLRSVIDTAKIRRSDKSLRITAANVRRGVPKTFRNVDLDDENGYRAVAASSVIPGAGPPELIDLEHFVDGAVLMNDPLEPAIEARDKSSKRRLILHVIYLDPEFESGPQMELTGSFSTVYRMLILAFSRSVNAAVERAARINNSLILIDLLRDLDPVYSSTGGPDGSEVMKVYQRLNKDTAEGVELEIHRYRSSKHLGGIMDLFQFDKGRVEDLISRGYGDAQVHDCQVAECLLPART